jgi:hypothetical protein
MKTKILNSDSGYYFSLTELILNQFLYLNTWKMFYSRIDFYRDLYFTLKYIATPEQKSL